MSDNQKQIEINSEDIENKKELSEQPDNNTPVTNVEKSVFTNNSAESKSTNIATETYTQEMLEQELANTQELEQAIEALQQEIGLLKQRLSEQTEKTDSFKNQYVRLVADFENFRRRVEKEKETQEQQVKRNTISEILSVVDNFERARTQLKPANEGEMAIHKSYQGVYKNLADSLKRIGVAPMRPEGQPFDPNFHEALLQEPSNEYPEGTVIEQLMRGYLLGDQVLRHAKVKVATADTESVNSGKEEEPDRYEEIDLREE